MKEKFTFSIISQFFIQILTIIANYFLFLYLDIELIGTWALLNSIVSLGFVFVDLGLVSIHYQYSEKKDFDDYFSTFFVIKIILLSINIVLSFIIITIFELWVSKYINIVLLILISFLIAYLFQIFSIHLQAKLKVIKVQSAQLIVNLGKNLSILYIALNLRFLNNPLFWLAFSIIIFNLLYAILIIFLSKNEIRFVKPQKSTISNYLRDTKPLIIFSVLSIATSNLGNIILAYSYDVNSLAYFNLVQAYILPVFGVLSTIVISIGTPLFSRYLANGDNYLAEKTLHIIEKYISIFYLSVILIIFIVGRLLFSLFLPNYLNSLPILYLMIFNSYLTSINRSYGVILISGKKQKLSAKISSFNISLILFLIIIFIPKKFLNVPLFGLGSIGYALAYLISGIISSFILRFYTKKEINIKPQKKVIVHLLLIIPPLIICYFLRSYVLNNLIQNQIFFIIVLIFISLLLFFSELFIFKILKKEDIKFFLRLLKLTDYSKSFKEEFLIK